LALAALGCQLLTAGPTPAPTSQPTRAAEADEETADETGAGEEPPYSVDDIGEDETPDGEPMAYVAMALDTPDVTDAGFEAQARWGWALLSEEYPAAEVLELQLTWDERLMLGLDARASDWAEVAADETDWEDFWPAVDVYAIDLDSGDYYEGDDALAALADLAGTAEAIGTEAAATPEPASDAVEVSLDNQYLDPNGFFALDYAADWIVQEYRAGVHFWADENGRAGLDLAQQIKSVSARFVASDYSSFFYEQLEGYEELGWEDITLSDLPGVWVDLTYEEEGEAMRGFMATVVRNRAGYLLFGYAPEDEYEALEPVLRATAGSLALTDFEDAPPYAEWETFATDHIQFYYLPDTYVAEDIENLAGLHEQALEDNAGWLGLTYAGPTIGFFFYPEVNALYAATARESGFAINDGVNDVAEVHAIWAAPDDHQSIGHELTHVITYWTLGDAGQALLGEGVAVCLDHGDVPVHVRAGELWAADSLIPLSDMLGDAWFEQDPAVAYPESGSVACWLLERYGLDSDSFAQLYPREDFEEALEEIYGFDLAYLEEDWLTMLSHN
jgi:hypothetical protein